MRVLTYIFQAGNSNSSSDTQNIGIRDYLGEIVDILSTSPPPVALSSIIIYLTVAGGMYYHYSGKDSSTFSERTIIEDQTELSGKAIIAGIIAYFAQAVSTAGFLPLPMNIILVLSSLGWGVYIVKVISRQLT